MALKTLNRSYVPVTEELTEAIVAILDENKEADTKAVQAFLMLQHKDWRVPERRVRKFVKRHRRQLGFEGVDDDASTMSDSSYTFRPKPPLSSIQTNIPKGGESGSVATEATEATDSTGTLPKLIVPLGEMKEEQALSPLRNGPSNDDLVTPSSKGLSAGNSPSPDKFSTPPETASSSPDQFGTPGQLDEKLKLSSPSPARTAVDDAAISSPAKEGSPAAPELGKSLYHDDNDGKREGDLCQQCNNCIIL